MLTEGQRAYARQLRDRIPPVPWDRIARALGPKVTVHMVMSEIVPGYLERRAAQSRAARHRLREGAPLADHRVESVQRATGRQNPTYDPRRDGRPIYRSAFAELLGEPPIGRRAIDQRREPDAPAIHLGRLA
jgi:hypothetical protein